MAVSFGGRYSPDGNRKSEGENARHTAPGADSARGQTPRGPSATPPAGAHRFDGKRVDTSCARPNFLFLTTLPLLLSAFSGGALTMAADLTAFGVLVLAFWLLREGLKAEAAFRARTVAKRPAIPRKLFSLALTGLGVTLASAPPGGGVTAPVIFGAVAAVLHFLAFGADPMRDKGVEGVDRMTNDRLTRAITEGETMLAEMQRAIAATRDRDLRQRVEGFAATVREMFRRLEADPRDLRGARRYLSVYLQGARDATVKFTELQARSPDPAARDSYAALLRDLQANFAARSEALLLDDRSDLDIEIEVLRERLQRDGLTAD